MSRITFLGSISAVNMSGMIENVEIRHCNLISSYDGTRRGTVSCSNAYSSNYLKNVRFIGNNIRGHYFNMYFNYSGSSATNMSKASVTIDSNCFSGAYYAAIYAYNYNNFKSISHNNITCSSASSNFMGIGISSYCLVNRIEGNRIRLDNSSTGYGIRLRTSYNDSSHGATSAATVANNEIILTGNGEKYGIFTYLYPMYNIVNNSVYVKGNATCHSLYCLNNDSNYKLNILNNILVNDHTDGYAFFIAQKASYTSSYGMRDFNNYYSRSNSLTYLNDVTQTTLAAIKAVATDQDQHSISACPTWANADSICPKNLEIAGARKFSCNQAFNVLEDILGMPRADITAMGCYGLVPDSNDAQLTGFANVDSITSTGTHPVRVIIRNAGTNPIDSAIINLTISGVTQKPVIYRPSSPLRYLQSDTVTIANLAFKYGKMEMQAVVSMNGDTNSSNDTAYSRHIVGCSRSFAGTITIGNSMSADYALYDFPIMVQEMSRCGVSGDITLQIEDGTYTTQH